MDLSETFYAAAAGVFPLLVVAIVVAIRFNLGETRRDRHKHQELVDSIASFLEQSPQQAEAMTDRIMKTAEAGDRLATEAAIQNLRKHSMVKQAAEMVQERDMPQSEKKIKRRYDIQRSWAWSTAVLFGMGEMTAFASLALGPKRTAVRDLFGAVTLTALFLLILLSAVSLVVQAVHAEHD